MIPENYEKKFHNKLQIFNFNNCSELKIDFSLQDYQQLINPEEPSIVKLFADSSKLHTLSLKKCGLNKNIADLLYLTLDQNR